LVFLKTFWTGGSQKMAQRIATVVIPAAGRGTRLLPATKVTPKELLNVYDRPALQFAIDEAIDLGVKRIVVVTHPDKQSIRDYLTPDPAYADELRACGKVLLGDALSEIEVPARIQIAFVDQPEPLGLGHAILCAEGLALPGPFGVILPDDLVLGPPCLSEMAEHYAGGHMIAAMEVNPDETRSYGIFRMGSPSVGRSVSVLGMVEKPAPGFAPSRLAAVGRYILDPCVFATLRHLKRGAGGEIQLTDALARDADRVALNAFRFSGTRYDCGSHDGLLDAAVARRAMVKQRTTMPEHSAAFGDGKASAVRT
jgi:UTP--glucose-1-phosphate uridylyltransferase